MFTVIIAEKGILEMSQKFNMFLAPLLDNDIAFCEWNRDGESLDEMLPTLYDLIALKDKWRAIIVNQDGLNKINPFDFTEYSDSYRVKNKVDWGKLQERRAERFVSYEKAISNPLVRLTAALNEPSVYNLVIEDSDDFDGLINGQLVAYEYMLANKLQSQSTIELAAGLENYSADYLKRYAGEAQVPNIISKVRDADVEGLIELIGVGKILDFIELISANDPFYCDPEFLERRIENTKKKQLFDSIFENYHLQDKKPSEIICVAPRTFDYENHEQNIKWEEKDETDYSKFAEYNLYPEKVKYLLFDMLPEDDKQYIADQIRFLSFLLVLSGNLLPGGSLTKERVYRANIEFDGEAIGRYGAEHLKKLRATIVKIRELERKLQVEESGKLDNKTSQELFEAEIHVPVEINSEYKKEELFAKYNGLGLSKDCPQDEYGYWDGQYRSIGRLFIRYLREPRRAVKTAVKGDFRAKKSIDDDRALLMNEYQREDVEFKLLEEEQNMIETVTTQLFNTAEYNKRIEEADKELRRGIGQRMTKKVTIIVGLISVLVYLIGFIPLLVSNGNTTNAFVVSLAMTGIAIGAFALVGFIFLFVLRHRLINRFKHFNYVMSGICKEIENGLKAFSKYLSHACNVMREYSVLNYSDKTIAKKHHILRKHELDIRKKIEEVGRTFGAYIPEDVGAYDDVEPYDFDFKVLRNYQYEMPTYSSEDKIEFIQPGHEIIIPVDYVKAITITREELYD